MWWRVDEMGNILSEREALRIDATHFKEIRKKKKMENPFRFCSNWALERAKPIQIVTSNGARCVTGLVLMKIKWFCRCSFSFLSFVSTLECYYLFSIRLKTTAATTATTTTTMQWQEELKTNVDKLNLSVYLCVMLEIRCVVSFVCLLNMPQREQNEKNWIDDIWTHLRFDAVVCAVLCNASRLLRSIINNILQRASAAVFMFSLKNLSKC